MMPYCGFVSINDALKFVGAIFAFAEFYFVTNFIL